MYGSFRSNAELTQQLAGLVRGPIPVTLALIEEHVHMACHKTSRMAIGGQAGDSLVDLRGYALRTLEEMLDDDHWAVPGAIWGSDQPPFLQLLVTAKQWYALPYEVSDFIVEYLTALYRAVRSRHPHAYEEHMKEYC